MINLALLVLKWVLLVLLYVFLFAAVVVVARDLKAPASSAAKKKKPSASSARMVVLESPGVQAGETFFLEGGAVIGRSSESDIEIPDTSVSHQHASVYQDGKYFKVEDLGSKNGTYLNQEETTGPVRLKHGDVIKVGKTTFEFMEK